MAPETSEGDEARAIGRVQSSCIGSRCLAYFACFLLAACSFNERSTARSRSSQTEATEAQESDTGVARKPSAPLDLLMMAQIAVPDSVALIDARIHQSGSIVAWGSGRGVWLFRKGKWKQLGRNVARAVGARFAEGDSVLEVVDRGRGAVVTVDVHGFYHTRYAFRPTHVVEAATAVADGWYVIGSNVEGDFVGTRVWVNEHRSESQVIWSRGTSARSYSARVSGHDQDAVIAQYGPPFRVQQLGRDKVLRTLPALPDTLLSRLDGREVAGSDTARWGALRVIPIRDGELLQSFTDLRSDRRMLVLRDRAGRFDRAKMLTAPVSLLDVDSASRQVLGARRTTQTEFVIYNLVSRNGVAQAHPVLGDAGARHTQATARR